MKHYEKPTVEMYSLCGNETICGGCESKLMNNSNLKQLITMDFPETDSNGDKNLSKDEVLAMFGTGESCKIEIEGYCKFTGTVSGLSWS